MSSPTGLVARFASRWRILPAVAACFSVGCLDSSGKPASPVQVGSPADVVPCDPGVNADVLCILLLPTAEALDWMHEESMQNGADNAVSWYRDRFTAQFDAVLASSDLAGLSATDLQYDILIADSNSEWSVDSPLTYDELSPGPYPTDSVMSVPGCGSSECSSALNEFDRVAYNTLAHTNFVHLREFAHVDVTIILVRDDLSGAQGSDTSGRAWNTTVGHWSQSPSSYSSGAPWDGGTVGDDPLQAIAVAEIDSVTTVAHELGHLLGLKHNHSHDADCDNQWNGCGHAHPVPPPPGVSPGFDMGPGFRTLMAYDNDCPGSGVSTWCPRSFVWSDPNISVAAAPRENNAKVSTRTWQYVSRFSNYQRPTIAPTTTICDAAVGVTCSGSAAYP